MIDTQPSLLTWHAAPTTSGPRTAASDGERTRATPAERWAAFVAANPDIAAHVLRWAQADVQAGRRTSAKEIAEKMRRTYRCEWNNSMTSGCADWLAESVPGIKIERRTRTR